MASGTTTVDFGAFPGSSHVTVDVTGQTGFISTSRHEAYIQPVATADHSTDEHVLETIGVKSVYQADGTIRIHAFNTSQLNERLERRGKNPDLEVGGIGTLIYGVWTVAWVWSNT